MSKDFSVTTESQRNRMRYVSESNSYQSNINVDDEILFSLKRCGYDFGVRFPCSRLKGLYDLLEADKDITVVTVTREEEGFGVCAGAYLAGKRPFMLIQSSGLGNSFNAIASLLKTYRIPTLIMASYRGYYNEKIPAQIPLGNALPDMLDAMQIPFLIVEDNLKPVEPFTEKMYKKGEPHIVLLSPELYENA